MGPGTGGCIAIASPTLLFFCCAASSPLSRSSSERSMVAQQRASLQTDAGPAAGGSAAAALRRRQAERFVAVRRAGAHDRDMHTCGSSDVRRPQKPAASSLRATRASGPKLGTAA